MDLTIIRIMFVIKIMVALMVTGRDMYIPNPTSNKMLDGVDRR